MVCWHYCCGCCCNVFLNHRATLLKEKFQPKSEKSLLLRTHCQTSGWSLTEQDPFNNIIRTTVEVSVNCAFSFFLVLSIFLLSRPWQRFWVALRACTPMHTTKLSDCRLCNRPEWREIPSWSWEMRPVYLRYTSPLSSFFCFFLECSKFFSQVIDPWGGSYMMESLTEELVKSARKIIDEVEELGGMAPAVEKGIPKLRIEEAAARKQAAYVLFICFV